MASRRDQRKQERARAADGQRSAATERQAAARQLVERVAAAAAAAATEHLAPAAVVASAEPAQAAAGVRSLALQVMQRSSLHGKHACVAGCACCCHTAVTVAAPEVFAIADYLRQTLAAADLAAVRSRLDQNAARAAGCTRDEYIAALIPCGLLTPDGNCRAHPVRPLACAGFLSTSRAACEAEFRREPGRTPVPTDRFAMLVGLGASHGLRQACAAAGLDGEFYELHHALRVALAAPDAAARWLRGEPVFADCLK